MKKRRYQHKISPLKDRQEMWDTVNFANTDGSIARLMGFDRKTVNYQRKKRGVPPFSTKGHKRDWRYNPGNQTA